MSSPPNYSVPTISAPVVDRFLTCRDTLDSMAKCMFCGIGTQTKEDALPRWVWAHLDVRGEAEIRRQSDGKLVRRTETPDVRVGGPCRACNGGWMSRLETGFHGVGGARLLAGDAPVVLPRQDLGIVATWVMKTALMLHEAFAHQTGRVTVPGSHYEALRSGAPPEGTLIYVGGVNAAGRDINFLRPIQLDHSGDPVGYIMAMSMGYLLTIIAAPIVPTAIWSGPIPTSLVPHFDQIWPLPSEAINWPRTRDLTVDGFDEAWSRITWRGAVPATAG
jgi:hypothetical protein